ncbi:MAG: hypothetical protein JWN86_2778 [Planctomycetota bacterium]|nr:hypothetical protein [Planctomycetota bacterium]
MRASPKKTRRGVALLMVVACLAVLAIVLGVLLRIGVAERRQSLASERRLRATWLAESGLERAWAGLSRSRDYGGETWDLSPETLHGRDGALVVIAVERIPGSPDRRKVTARADYPREGSSRVRQTRTTVMNLTATAPGESQ